MGLFSKKPPCPICGGKISWFLPTKIEGEYICDSCSSKIDMQDDRRAELTMQKFRDYLAFYDQYQPLRDKFVVSERVDFGAFDTKIIFDFENRLFCMSSNPDKTIFEGKHLKSFVVKEDSSPLFEGSAAGIIRYTSSVPDHAMALTPLISQFMVSKQLARTMDKLDDGKVDHTNEPTFDVAEPFRKFNVELHFDHPYWSFIKCDMDGPRFDMHNPDVNDYIRDYQRCIEELEKMVGGFSMVAFPNAPQQRVGLGQKVASTAGAAAVSSTDPIEEIKKYKALMEEGIISQQEFDAKKKQLLGI